VSGPVETFRGAVRAEHCDQFGHMNVQFYTAALSDAFFHLMVRIGLNEAEVRRRRLGLAAVRMEMDFRAELRANDLFRVESGFFEASERKLIFAHRMSFVDGGETALTARSVGIPMDLDARRRTPLPGDILAAARQLLTDPEALGHGG
jgi:acyl-CoA thioester hydrolase